MEIVILLWVVCGVAAGIVASNRGSGGCLWFGIGVLFGPFGLAAAFLIVDTKQCPKCKREIARDAVRCPSCQADLTGAKIDAAPPMKRCPFCAERILYAAVKCRYCGEFLDGRSASDEGPKSEG